MNLVEYRSSLWVSTGWLNRGGLETSVADSADSEDVEEVASPGTKESRSTGTT
jgi:hypothetical protein